MFYKTITYRWRLESAYSRWLHKIWRFWASDHVRQWRCSFVKLGSLFWSASEEVSSSFGSNDLTIPLLVNNGPPADVDGGAAGVESRSFFYWRCWTVFWSIETMRHCSRWIRRHCCLSSGLVTVRIWVQLQKLNPLWGYAPTLGALKRLPQEIL